MPLLGDARLGYPENHIEADVRLAWFLGRLDRKYGDNAFYVHLRRNDMETARSFTARYSQGIMRAYRGGGILMGLPEDTPPIQVALDYCDTVNSNIELFLKDKTHKMNMRLETWTQDFPKFWQAIGAEGDLEAALAKLGTRFNSTEQIRRAKPKPIPRAFNKLKRIVTKQSSHKQVQFE